MTKTMTKGLSTIIKHLKQFNVEFDLTTLVIEHNGHEIQGNAIKIGNHYFVAYNGMVLYRNEIYYFEKYTFKNQKVAIGFIFGYNNILPNNFVVADYCEETGELLGFTVDQPEEQPTEETTEETTEKEIEEMQELKRDEMYNKTKELSEEVNTKLSFLGSKLDYLENVLENDDDILLNTNLLLTFYSTMYLKAEPLRSYMTKKEIEPIYKNVLGVYNDFMKYIDLYEKTIKAIEKLELEKNIQPLCDEVFSSIKKNLNDETLVLQNNHRHLWAYSFRKKHGKQLLVLENSFYNSKEIIVDYETLEFISASNLDFNTKLNTKEIIEMLEFTLEKLPLDKNNQVEYNNAKENNKEEKVESIVLNNQVEKIQEEKNVQVEIIDYTRDYVYYYECVTTARIELEKLCSKYPNNEIGVSYFTVYGVDIEWNEENIDFVEKSSPLELEAVVKILEHGYTNTKSLPDAALYMENSLCYYLISNEENKLNAFIELVDELGGVEFIENKDYYVDLEYLKRDYELSGDEIVQDMLQDEFEKFVYDCDLLNNDTIEAYFDYEKYMRDFELSGSSIIELENKNFLFIF